MPNYAIVENGKVVNVVVAEADYAALQNWIACPDDAGIDWDYINGQFVDNRPTPIIEPTLAVVPTKQELLAQLQALQAQIAALP